MRAAVVIAVKPLLIAAYTDELDCIAMLHFPEELAAEYALALCMDDSLLLVLVNAPSIVPVFRGTDPLAT